MSSRQELLNLDQDRKALQQKIIALNDYLKAPGMPGLKGNLVDAQGFPRNDIDIYEVRKARHDLACLQTDHQALMKKIEQGLLAYHADTKPEELKEPEEEKAQPRTHGIIVEGGVKRVESARIPFAWVAELHQNSPADLAGLKVGDAVVQFGWADHRNHQNLSALAKIVGASIGQPVKVSVLRKGEKNTVDLTLTPNKWEGKGMLGQVGSIDSRCRLVPNPLD